jgi:hypothetical protein
MRPGSGFIGWNQGRPTKNLMPSQVSNGDVTRDKITHNMHGDCLPGIAVRNFYGKRYRPILQQEKVGQPLSLDEKAVFGSDMKIVGRQGQFVELGMAEAREERITAQYFRRDHGNLLYGSLAPRPMS